MAHTLKVIALGIVLFAVCMIIGRVVGGAVDPKAMARAAIIFVPLWFLGAGINMWYGVSKAGYSFVEELPYFAAVFLVPAGLAVLVYWRYSHTG